MTNNKEWLGCTACYLSQLRKQVVLGTGDVHSPLAFIGINPGKEEDRQGKPFVGRAGKLLDEGLKSVVLKRRWVWISNVCKCWSGPGNPEPTEEQARTCCDTILQQELEEVNPLVIVPIGAFPLFCLTGRTGISNKAGQAFTVKELKTKGMIVLPKDSIVFPLLHPAYILRNGAVRERYFQDWQRLRELIETEGVIKP